jgi:hypothetical protein
MDFDLESTRDGEVLEVAFTGRVTEANAQALVRRYFDLVRAERPAMVLADTRRLGGRLSLSRVYFLLRDLPKPVPNAVKTAFLARPDRAEDADFLETTAHNAGVGLKAFIDRDAALTWLRAP